jgi:hypothetical protein
LGVEGVHFGQAALPEVVKIGWFGAAPLVVVQFVQGHIKGKGHGKGLLLATLFVSVCCLTVVMAYKRPFCQESEELTLGEA